MKPSHITSTLALCLLLPLSACAGTGQGQESLQEPVPADGAAAQATAGDRVVEAEVAWQGAVTAVDADARLITLRDADGQERSFRIDEEVQRLDKMQPGDVVEIYYQRSLVFDMQPAGSAEPGAYIWQDEQHPDPERPGVVDREVVVVLAPLVAVDAQANTISVRGPSGGVRVLDVEQARHREALADLEIGDLLRIQFHRLLAVRITPEQAGQTQPVR